MRYPVVNLGGLLEDYQNEINRLKEKLNTGGYMQPGPTPVYTPPPAAPVMPPSNPPTGPELAPPIRVYGTPSYDGGQERLPQYQPATVSTGVPPNPAEPPWAPVDYGPRGTPCPSGYSRDASGVCVKNPDVPSTDPNYPPTIPTTPLVSQPVPPPPPPPPPAETTAGPDVPTSDCPPGYTRTATGCFPDVATGGGVRPGGFSLPGGSLFSGGGGTSAVSLMGGVRHLGGPLLLKPIRLRGH